MSADGSSSWSATLFKIVDYVFQFSSNEPTENSDDEKHDGDDLILDGDHLCLKNPRYKLPVLHRICRCGPQFTSLEICGDWTNGLKDLLFIIPAFTSVRRVSLNLSDGHCKGVDALVGCIAKLPQLESFDAREMHYDCESIEELLSNPTMKRLYLNEDSLRRNPDDLDAILFTIDPNYGDCKLVEFEGVPLNQFLHLWSLEEAGLSQASNAEILKFVRGLNAHKNEEEEDSDNEDRSQQA